MIYITHIFPHDIPIAILYYSRQTCPAAVDRLRAAEKVVAQLPLGQLFVIDLLGLHVISAVNPNKSQTQDQVFRSSFFHIFHHRKHLPYFFCCMVESRR